MNAETPTPTRGTNNVLNGKRALRLQLPIAQRRVGVKTGGSNNSKTSTGRYSSSQTTMLVSPYPISKLKRLPSSLMKSEGDHSAAPFAGNASTDRMATPAKKRRRGPPGRAVQQICKESGKILHEYDSASEAARLFSSDTHQRISRRAIRDALNGKNVTAAGYVWRYKRDQSPEKGKLLSIELHTQVATIKTRLAEVPVLAQDTESTECCSSTVTAEALLTQDNDSTECCSSTSSRQEAKDEEDNILATPMVLKHEEDYSRGGDTTEAEDDNDYVCRISADDEDKNETKSTTPIATSSLDHIYHQQQGMEREAGEEKEEEALGAVETGTTDHNDNSDDHNFVVLDQDVTIALERSRTRGRMLIDQISMDDPSNIIATYSNIGKAAYSALGVTPEGLYRCILGFSESCGGYYWRKRQSKWEQDGAMSLKKMLPSHPTLEAQTNVEHSHEHPQQQSLPSSKATPRNSLPSKVATKAEAQKWSRGTIYQIDVSTGKVVAEYPTVLKAANAIREDRRLIQAVLSGKTPTAGGYFWRKKSLSIQQISISTGIVVAEYSTQSEAASALNISRRSIRDVLSGKNPTAAGYFWRKT